MPCQIERGKQEIVLKSSGILLQHDTEKATTNPEF